ncbi:uncharacterized protein LOC135483257 isoform X2 [Lineus longissimus]|uniref:uncharacterized protein LOC135483257 isoform X2 n=1 Tax=Lineus longissimus TaxID=88925 RepID=UPI002B4D5634
MASNGDQEDVSKSGGNPSMTMRMTLGGIRTRFPSVEQLSTHGLHDLITKEEEKSRVVILDVRPEDEYNVSHIDGAIRVDPDDRGEAVLEVVKGSLGDEQAPSDLSQPGESIQVTVVCYCSLGYRSCAMAQKLTKARDSQSKGAADQIPYPNLTVYNLEGSLFKWANEQKPMVDKQNKPTVYAHPYNMVFRKLLQRNLRKYPSKESEKD